MHGVHHDWCCAWEQDMYMIRKRKGKIARKVQLLCDWMSKKKGKRQSNWRCSCFVIECWKCDWMFKMRRENCGFYSPVFICGDVIYACLCSSSRSAATFWVGSALMQTVLKLRRSLTLLSPVLWLSISGANRPLLSLRRPIPIQPLLAPLPGLPVRGQVCPVGVPIHHLQPQCTPIFSPDCGVVWLVGAVWRWQIKRMVIEFLKMIPNHKNTE